MTQIFNRHEEKTKRQSLRNAMPPAEILLWKHLRGKQLGGRKFRRQHSVEQFVLDFYCPALKLAIELDGNSVEPAKPTPKVEAPDDASVAQDKSDLIAWNLHTGKNVLWQGSTHAPEVNVLIYPRNMRFSSDGNTLSGLVSIQTPDPNYPAGSGYVESRLAIRSWKLGNPFEENSPQTPPVTTTALEESRLSTNPIFSPDGSLVMASDIKGIIHFWDSATGRLSGESWKTAP